MLIINRWFRIGAGLALLACAACSGGYGTPSTAKTETKEGYNAAKHGYWQEAQLRFERARQLKPDDPEVLNNLGVALEAVGRFEEAIERYEQALLLDPRDKKIKRNLRLSKEFYETYMSEPEEQPDGESDGKPDGATVEAEEGLADDES